MNWFKKIFKKKEKKDSKNPPMPASLDDGFRKILISGEFSSASNFISDQINIAQQANDAISNHSGFGSGFGGGDFSGSGAGGDWSDSGNSGNDYSSNDSSSYDSSSSSNSDF